MTKMFKSINRRGEINRLIEWINRLIGDSRTDGRK